MTKQNQATLRIEWVRSGIAFDRKQKEIVRSLGLRRLHHVVERADNPVVRGLIAKVSHLVEVREETKASAWKSVPEYTILAPEPLPEAAGGESSDQPPAAETSSSMTARASAEPTGEPETGEASSASEQVDETSEQTRT